MDRKSAAQSKSTSGMAGSATQSGETHEGFSSRHSLEFPASHVTQPS